MLEPRWREQKTTSQRPLRAKPLVEPLMVRTTKTDGERRKKKERRRFRRYYRKNRKWIRKAQKVRRQIPEVRQKLLKYYRNRYRRLKKKIRAQQNAHYHIPAVKRRVKAYRSQPNILERERIRLRTYYSEHPAAKRKRARYLRNYFTRPDVIKSREEYFARLDIKKKRRELNRMYHECRRNFMPMLDSDNPFDRQSAAYSLGSRRFRHAIGRLTDLLWDDEDFVRSAAVWALGETNDIRSVKPLILAAENAKNNLRWQFLKEASGALAKISTKQSLEYARMYSAEADKHL